MAQRTQEKTCLLTRLPFFFIKRILKYRNQQPDEEILGQNTGKGQSLQALLRPTTFAILHMFTDSEALQTLETLFHGHSWPLAIGDRFNLQAFSHRWSKLDWKFLSNNMVLLATGPHLWVGSKSHLSRRVLRNSVRETKYYFIAPFAQKIPRVLKAIS